MGRDSETTILAFLYGCFNPRARMGRDRQLGLQRFCLIGSFNPRARMGRDNYTKMPHVLALSFNPRARMGRDSV